MLNSLKGRIGCLERGITIEGRGIDILLTILSSRPESDVIGVDVGPNASRITVWRRPGESLVSLESRANPDGCWRAAPTPLFDGEGESEGDEALRLMLHMRLTAGLRMLP